MIGIGPEGAEGILGVVPERATNYLHELADPDGVPKLVAELAAKGVRDPRGQGDGATRSRTCSGSPGGGPSNPSLGPTPVRGERHRTDPGPQGSSPRTARPKPSHRRRGLLPCTGGNPGFLARRRGELEPGVQPEFGRHLGAAGARSLPGGATIRPWRPTLTWPSAIAARGLARRPGSGTVRIDSSSVSRSSSGPADPGGNRGSSSRGRPRGPRDCRPRSGKPGGGESRCTPANRWTDAVVGSRTLPEVRPRAPGNGIGPGTERRRPSPAVDQIPAGGHPAGQPDRGRPVLGGEHNVRIRRTRITGHEAAPLLSPDRQGRTARAARPITRRSGRARKPGFPTTLYTQAVVPRPCSVCRFPKPSTACWTRRSA